LDPHRFKADVEREGIEVTRIHIDSTLMIFLFDASPGKGSMGPFTVEITFPQITPTNIDIDFDVNNLCITRDNPKHLSMRIPHPRLTVPGIIKRIQNGEFMCCKAGVSERIEKMESRGWKRYNTFFNIYVPGTDEGAVRLLVKDYATDPQAKLMTEAFLADLPGARIKRVWKIQNNVLEKSFEAYRELLRDEHKKRLGWEDRRLDAIHHGWHGTTNAPASREGIAKFGLDDRFWSDGMFGFAAYLAAHPRKSDFFAQADGNNEKAMFYCKVLRGLSQHVEGEGGGNPSGAQGATAPDPPHNSILGTNHCPDQTVDEYVIFRTDQIVPIYQIDYVK
jgi:hypothetical protein